MSSRVSMLSQHEKQQQNFRSLSSQDLGYNSSATVGSPGVSWSNWGSFHGKPDWTVNADEFGRLRRSSSFELGNNGDEPDLSYLVGPNADVEVLGYQTFHDGALQTFRIVAIRERGAEWRDIIVFRKSKVGLERTVNMRDDDEWLATKAIEA